MHRELTDDLEGTPPRASRLRAAFALLSLTTTWSALQLLHVGSRAETAPFRVLLLVPSLFVGAALGHVAERALARPLRRGVRVVALSTLATGFVLGLIPCLGVHDRASLFDPLVGALVAAAALPAALAAFFAERRIGRAREGSIVDQIDARATHLVVATALPIGLSLTRSSWIDGWSPAFRALPGVTDEAPTMLSLAALGALVAITLADLGALLALRRAATLRLGMTALAHAPPVRARRSAEIDVGLGDEHHALLGPAEGPYRSPRRVRSSVRGEPSLGAAVARGAVVRDAVALGAASAAFALVHLFDPATLVARPTPPPAARVDRPPVTRIVPPWPADDLSRSTAPDPPSDPGPGVVGVGRVSVSGGRLTAPGAVVSSLSRSFARCYRKGLSEDPEMRGTLRVTAKIDARGEVLSSSFASSTLSGTVGSCALAALGTAQFGNAEGEPTLTFAISCLPREIAR